MSVPTPTLPEHPPLRPSWLCRRCGQVWPCEPAKQHIVESMNGDLVAVAVFMASAMSDAIRDLYQLTPNNMPTPAEVWDRFLQWLDVARNPRR